MLDPRGKRVVKGKKVSALVGMGAQIMGRVARITPEALLFEATVNLPGVPEQRTGCIVLVDEGMEEIGKDRWNMKARKLKILDQRENPILEGADIVALMPATVQIVGTVIEAVDPTMLATRQGKQWRHGVIEILAHIVLPIVNGRAPCCILPPEDEDNKGKRDSSGILLLN